jgi:biotin operon repressor
MSLILAVIRDAGPVTIADLARNLGRSRRDIEAAVEELRLAGEPIVGGSDGLRLTSDPDELAAYLEARRRRMASQYRGSRALRRTLRAMRERADLTLWGAT